MSFPPRARIARMVRYAGAVAAAYHAGASVQAGRPRPYLFAVALVLACPLLGTSEVPYARRRPDGALNAEART